MRTMVHVIATINLKPDTRDAFLALFHELVPKVTDEDGCISYIPTIDVEANLGDVQEGPRDHTVTVVEAWESVEHLQAHLVAPHMDEYREKVSDMVTDMKVQVLAPAA